MGLVWGLVRGDLFLTWLLLRAGLCTDPLYQLVNRLSERAVDLAAPGQGLPAATGNEAPAPRLKATEARGPKQVTLTHKPRS